MLPLNDTSNSLSSANNTNDVGRTQHHLKIFSLQLFKLTADCKLKLRKRSLGITVKNLSKPQYSEIEKGQKDSIWIRNYI